MSGEEKKAIERQFEMALDTIISKIKGETATAIVYSEQPMILLFKKLVYTIEKQSKEIEELTSALLDSTPNDKIKAKIEEYNKMINATYEDLTYYGNCRRNVCIEIKNILQSLLEEDKE